ncbi:hypothetical protein [Dactylosporangium sp. NPDC048998]|uniref:hypothetical protein n=1 Tax=Dactylosporangium sp. NPDC048998 TaxID=3363976 RepID=UPI00371C0F37
MIDLLLCAYGDGMIMSLDRRLGATGNNGAVHARAFRSGHDRRSCLPPHADQASWGVADLANELAIGQDQVRSAPDELFELSLLRQSVEREGHLRAVSPLLALRAPASLTLSHRRLRRRARQADS